MIKPFLILCFLLTTCFSFAIAQKYLVIDNYNTKRIKLSVGDDIIFTQLNNKTKYNDYIRVLKDSSLILGDAAIEFPLRDFDTFYFHRPGARFASAGTTFIGGGFLFASAIHPVVREARYDRQESLIIGASFIAISQIFRLLHVKKFKIRKDRSRVRILDLTFR